LNKYATSAADLGTGLTNSASSLALAGNSIDETLAMITAMTEITQDASESGNALKILSMRLRGMKGELEALGEESDGLESISKIQTQILNLTGGKVNIFEDDGSFKSTYEIMQGISDVWTEISETDQAQLLEIIAGKQRGNSISALLTNMSQANNALNDSLESSGSAYAEQERWMESIEAKSQQLQASLQSLSTTILDSNLVKGVVDFGTTTVNILDWIIDKIGVLTPLVGGVGIGAFVKNFAWLVKGNNNFKLSYSF
jgi:TP901 family phage tail tape measure protein